jgi:uncharacterized protein with FMN-binding domain
MNMTRISIHKSIPALMLAGAAAIPAGNALAASHGASTSHTYKGLTEQMRWGPVQVSIVVKNKKIIDVKASVSADTARSQVILQQALPSLRQEVLTAQSANINEVSGATDISSAYIQSLQAAIKSARAHKALR